MTPPTAFPPHAEREYELDGSLGGGLGGGLRIDAGLGAGATGDYLDDDLALGDYRPSEEP